MKFLNIFDQLTRGLVFLTSIICSIYVGYLTNHSGYQLLFLLPLIYGIVFVFLIAPILFKKTNMFIIIFTAITFTRYIILPVSIVYSGWYGGRSEVPPLSSSYDLALRLMIYELIISTIVIYFLFSKLKSKNIRINDATTLPQNKVVYIIFIIISLVLLGINPNALKSFAFIFPSESLTGLGSNSIFDTLTTYSLMTSKFIIFLLLISRFYRKFILTNNKVYIMLSLITVLLNIIIIVGDNRSNFIITAIVSFVLFYKLFPRNSKIPFVLIIMIILIMTSFITTHRNTVTITEGANPSKDFTNTLQVYLGGPYNVAIATETAKKFPESRTVSNLFYDFTRPAIGFNLIMKNFEDEFEFSNYLFNQRIYFSNHAAQIIPMIGQGYFYFGFIFSPLLLLLFIVFVYFLLQSIYKKNNIELFFFLTIPITRIGFAMGQNAGILINDATMFLLLNLLVFYLNSKISLKPKSNHTSTNVGENI